VKAPYLLIACALLAACSDSDDEPAQESSATPPAVAQQAPASPQPAPEQADPEQADLAANEAEEQQQPATDPCDLSGYDMSKMTVEQHEELVKRCAESKQ
jgi:hypothetical protein